MKNLLLLLFLSTSYFAFSQKSNTKHHLKKMGYDASEFAYTQEKVGLYPRGFIYKVDVPDTVYYFGCFDSDVKDVASFFEGNSKMIKLSVNSLLVREGLEIPDSIFVQPINIMLTNFKTLSGKNFELKDDTKYVITYYWKNSAMNKDYYENFRKIKQIAKNHPELNIHVIAVSTDKPR